MALLLSLFLGAGAAESQSRESVVDDLRRLWAAGDAEGLQGILAPSVRLDLEGQEYLGVPPRQAAAALGRLLERYPPTAPRLSGSGLLAGTTDRAHAELAWSPRDPDTGGPTDYILFASLRRFDEAWRITELRILR